MRGDRVSLLEVLRIDGASLDRTQVRDAAQGFLAEAGGHVYALYDAEPGELASWTQWLIELVPPTGRTWRVDQAGNGGNGTLLSVGGTLVVISGDVHPMHAITFAPFDAGARPPLDLALTLSPGSPYSHSPRVALVPRGVAVVWNEGGPMGLTSHLQVLDCCAD